MKDYYYILGISKDSSKDEIKRAYHILAHQFHPDKNNGNEKRFKEINEAYRILSNDISRREYDQKNTEASNSFQEKASSYSNKNKQESSNTNIENETNSGIFWWSIGISLFLFLVISNSGYLFDVPKSHNPTPVKVEELIPKTNEEICKERNGVLGTYNDQNNTCGCSEGYAYGEISKKCVSFVKSRDESCANTFPGTSFLKADQLNGGNICDCVFGSGWNDDRTGCYSQKEYDSSCKEQFGMGSYSKKINNKRTCGCASGYSMNLTSNACVTTSSIDDGCVLNVGRNSRYDGTIVDGKYNCTAPY